MKRNFVRSLLAMAGVACMGLSLLCTPIATQTVSAAAPEISSPDYHVYTWKYGIKIGTHSLYKRKLNCSTGNWEGDWIYIRELSDEELQTLIDDGIYIVP